MNFRHHVFSVNDNGGVSRRTQGNVQYGALFGYVYFLSVEHGIDSSLQARLFRELKKKVHRFIGDSILRVVEVKTNRVDGQPLTAFRIIRKKLPQMEL